MLNYLIAIAFGVLVFSLVSIKFTPYGEDLDLVKNRVEKVTGSTTKNRFLDEEFSKPLSERFFKPMFQGLINRVQKYIPQNTATVNTSRSQQSFDNMKKKLRQAGIKMNISDYLTLRFLIMAGVGILLFIIAIIMRLDLIYIILSGLVGIYLVFTIFRFSLASRVSRRRNSMQRQLPEVLDMLSVGVEAGLGLEQAMVMVVNHFDGPLIDEIAITNREIAIGRNRRDALLLMGERCDIDEAKTFVRSIVQASTLGISIKNVLRSQSALMRQTRRNKVEEKAMKVSVKILIPMAFFIFPVMFIVLLGPAAVSIMENFL